MARRKFSSVRAGRRVAVRGAVRNGVWAWLAVLAVLAIELYFVVGQDVVRTPLDMAVYLWGGRHVTQDAALYDLRAQGMWFTYPPFAAAAFWPLAQLPALAARLVWISVSVGALVVVCERTLRLARLPATALRVALFTAAALVLAPVRHTFDQLQVNLLLAALVLVDVERVARGRTRGTGFGIGIAAAIKLVPAIFVVWLLLARRTRAVLHALAAFAAAATIGFALAPHASVRYWLRLSRDTTRVGATYISNQSPFALVGRLAGGAEHVGAWYLVIPITIALVGLPVAAGFARRGDWLEGVTVAAITGLLVSPISWAHHWVWIVPALVVLWQRGGAWRATVAPTAALFVIAPMWYTPRRGGPNEYGWHGVVTLVANAYLVAAVAFLAGTVWWLRSSETPRRPAGARAELATR